MGIAYFIKRVRWKGIGIPSVVKFLWCFGIRLWPLEQRRLCGHLSPWASGFKKSLLNSLNGVACPKEK